MTMLKSLAASAAIVVLGTASAFAQSASADKPADKPVAPIAPGSTWSDFRGANRDGRYTAAPIRTVPAGW